MKLTAVLIVLVVCAGKITYTFIYTYITEINKLAGQNFSRSMTIKVSNINILTMFVKNGCRVVEHMLVVIFYYYNYIRNKII